MPEHEGGPNQWKYYTDDNTSAADGWYWIDGDQDGLEECYYFDKNGFMMADTRTPDGFQVNSDGFWTVSGQVQKRETPVQDLPTGLHEQEGGLIYRDEGGELAANAWRSSDGSWYYFDAAGHAVKGWQYIDGYKFYFDENACTLVQNLEGILSAQSFQIVVDRARCQVTVYAPDDGNGYIIPYREKKIPRLQREPLKPHANTDGMPSSSPHTVNIVQDSATPTSSSTASRERPQAFTTLPLRNTTNSALLPPTAASA